VAWWLLLALLWCFGDLQASIGAQNVDITSFSILIRGKSLMKRRSLEQSTISVALLVLILSPLSSTGYIMSAEIAGI
jgi:hypothetical protein